MKRITFLLPLLFILIGIGQAANLNFLPASGDWDVPANWSGAALPTAADKAFIDVDGQVCTVDSAGVAKAVVVSRLTPAGTKTCYMDIVTGADLTMDGWFTVGNQVDANGILTMSDGLVDAGGLIVGSAAIGTFTMTGGTMDLRDATFEPGLYVGKFPTGNGRIDLSGGTITTEVLVIEQYAGATGLINLQGGVLKVDGDVTAEIANYILNDKIIAQNDPNRGIVFYDFGVTTPGVTTVVSAGPVDHNIAYNPTPRDYADDVDLSIAEVTWFAGDRAAEHDVYFGTDFDAVLNATKAFPEYKTTQPLANTSYSLAGETFEMGHTYYWRIDEVNGLNIWKGTGWRFSIRNNLIEDNFETYLNSTELGAIWSLGSGASNLSLLTTGGYGSDQAMSFDYSGNTALVFRTPVNSDWAALPVASISVAFKGSASNDGEPVFIEVEDSSSNTARIYYAYNSIDPNDYPGGYASQLTTWKQFDAAFSDITDANPGFDLTDVAKISLGVGDGIGSSESGTIQFDALRLFVSRCLPDKIISDIVGDDCIANTEDLHVLTSDWLNTGYNVTATPPATGPVLWYKFDETGSVFTVNDYSGNNFHGDMWGTISWSDGSGGYDGSGYLPFTGATRVECTDAINGAVEQDLDGMTVSVWVKATAPVDGVIFQTRTISNAQQMTTWCPNKNGLVQFNAGSLSVSPYYDEVLWNEANPVDWSDKWHHYAFVKDSIAGEQRIYRDGELVAINSDANVSLRSTGLTVIGSKYDLKKYYTGDLDDFRIYDYALSHSEVLSLSGQPSPFSQPLLSEAEISGDGTIVNLADFAVLVDKWLEDQIWP